MQPLSSNGLRTPDMAVFQRPAIAGVVEGRQIPAVGATKGDLPDERGAKAFDSDTGLPTGTAGRPGDSAEISRAGLQALGQETDTQGSAAQTAAAVEDATDSEPPAESSAGSNQRELTREEKEQVSELRVRDAEVRTHEQAHKSAAGNLSSGAPSYEYEKGPDGRDYVVGGEVNITVSEGSTAQETLANAQQVQRAAQAPANPSSKDRAVAAKASQMASDARSELAQESRAEAATGSEEAPASEPASAMARSVGAYTDIKEQVAGARRPGASLPQLDRVA